MFLQKHLLVFSNPGTPPISQVLLNQTALGQIHAQHSSWGPSSSRHSVCQQCGISRYHESSLSQQLWHELFFFFNEEMHILVIFLVKLQRLEES